MMLTLLVFVFLLYVLFYTIIHSYVENQYMLEEQKILEIQAKEYSQDHCYLWIVKSRKL